ncbi:MAG TPA: T9SS type A sorting domain-containing protein [Flavobacteriales bacterium]|nr:T9SS type A sorting domain-containing protein [Flavobacteriales bacterium]
MERSILFPALLAATLAQAQDINAYRYWYDDAVSAAVTTTVAATPELVLNSALPTGSLAPGFHRFSMQARDTDGKWSVPYTTWFTRSSTTVNGYRYWLNDDPATVVTGTLTAAGTVDLNSALAMGSLARHYNLVTIQFSESDGLYSAPITKAFVRGTGEVNGYEYWIDDAIADRITNTISPAGVADLITDLPVPTTEGDHGFTIRFSSMKGTWSVPLSSIFSYVVSIEELPGLSDLLLFPNPATEQLGLRLNSDASRTLQLDVLDMAGRPVLALDPWAVQGSGWRNWDISGLARGTYLLRITGEKGSWATRFVKQ